MRYVGDLITIIRNRSHNQNFSLGSATNVIEDVVEGIGDQAILEFINEGQTHLQAEIINQHPTEFVVSKTIDVVANQESYTIPDNVFINNRLLSVQYSTNGLDDNFSILEQRPMRDRCTDTNSHPSFYIRRSGQILLNPIPTTNIGKIRVEYYRQIDRLSLRAGTFDSITESAGSITAGSLDIATTNDNLLNNIGDPYVCILDRDGVVKEYNVYYTNFDDGSGDLTIPSHTRNGTATLAVGDFAVVGRYTTTHSDLPNNCERFLTLYAQMRMLQMDSSQDWQDEFAMVQEAKADIINSFGDPSEDVQFFPVLDKQLVYY